MQIIQMVSGQDYIENVGYIEDVGFDIMLPFPVSLDEIYILLLGISTPSSQNSLFLESQLPLER